MEGDPVDNAFRIRLGEIGQRNDRDVVAEIACDVGLESLPRAAVTLDVLAADPIDLEAEPVRMPAAAVEGDRGEDLAPALGSEDRAGPQAAVPCDQILQ